MLSRGECKDQLLILEELPEQKIYPDKDALEELERMNKISINNNPTPWEKVSESHVLKVSYLNTRSIKNKFICIETDESLLKSDLMILSETWLDKKEDCNSINLSNYEVSLCGGGRGQGMASFYRRQFKIKECKEGEHMNIMKVTHNLLDIIGLYRSPNGNPNQLIENLVRLIDMTRPTVVMGDFNICLLKNKDNPINNFLKSLGFIQLVQGATHIEVIRKLK